MRTVVLRRGKDRQILGSTSFWLLLWLGVCVCVCMCVCVDGCDGTSEEGKDVRVGAFWKVGDLVCGRWCWDVSGRGMGGSQLVEMTYE